MELSVKDSEKYSYLQGTSRFKVIFVYLFGIVSWILVLYGFAGIIIHDPLYRYLVAPLLFILTVYHFVSFGINLFFKPLNLADHRGFIRSVWKLEEYPSVDIFLPICGEDISVLENTWRHVFAVEYRNYKVYVLDDSKKNQALHRKMAEKYGFTYLERPNKGEMKKAGNLKYGYERSNGEYIVIFDADFAPHKHFIKEALPYLMKNRTMGILQTPQFFDTTDDMHKRSMIEYGASYVQEDFYRVIQVARNELGGTLCCGSNAVYRRRALDEIGGTVQIEHSEDAHTGFALANRGWRVEYLPVILAKGLCPSDFHAYFHQQHRWCSGSMSLMRTKEFWQSRLSLLQKLCYTSGFLYYLHHPASILLSFQLFITLFLYNDYIDLTSAYPFYPFLIFSFIVLPGFRKPRLRMGSFLAAFTQLYAYSHAVYTALLGRNVGWIPTNNTTQSVSRAFNQTTKFVGLYTLTYVALVALAIRHGDLHLFDYNYYSIQFWIFWNLFFSFLLLTKMLHVIWAAEHRISVGRSAIISSISIAFQLYIPYILAFSAIFYLLAFWLT